MISDQEFAASTFEFDMSEKRPIDRQRDSSFSIRIAEGESRNEPFDFYKIGDERLLIVSSNCIHEITLPDQIDPSRTNPNLIPAQQRVLNYGTDAEFVGQILLTAKSLFGHRFLGPKIDYAAAMQLAFDAVKDVAAMHQIRLDLENAEDAAWSIYTARDHSKDSIRLPSVPNVESRCENYMQKANHVVTCIESLVKLFYASEISNKWIQNLEKLTRERYGPDSGFSQFIEKAAPFLLFMNSARNLVEHPKSDKHMKIIDYRINEKGTIISPTIEVIDANFSQPPISARVFMRDTMASITAIYEMMMAYLCERHLVPFGKTKAVLVEIPPEHRRHPNVRFGYAFEFGGQLSLVG